VAVEDGISEVFPPDGPPSRARYTNIHVKKDGRWLLSSVRESPLAATNNSEQLRELAWLIGEWAGQTPTGEEERIGLDWAANGNFIVGSFATLAKGAPAGSATQWIGWDPAAKRIRSWMFDDTGGFGEGVWTREGDKWSIKSSSVLHDGGKATATFIVGPVDADTITLRSKDRTVDGKPLPETREVKLKRVKDNQPR
jgi:hypothetical protein